MKNLKLIFVSCFIAGMSTGYTQDYFVTTWDTKLGDPGSTTIVLPIVSGAYDVDINNDGDFDDSVDLTNQSGTITIDFGSPGEYTIAVRPNIRNTAGKLQINHKPKNITTTPLKLISIKKWGDIVWGSMFQAFRGCENLTTIEDGARVPNLTGIKKMNMRFMFFGATNFEGDLREWNVSKVTNMSGTFEKARGFNGNIGNWDVSQVTNMKRMFQGATSFNGDVSNWNVSKVTNMNNMFANATIFNRDVSNWNVSNVSDMNNMFTNATIFNRDVSNWDVSKVTDMNNMFANATSFYRDVSNWNVSKVTDMNNMFANATIFNRDVSNWNVSNVTDMNNMFANATIFNRDVSNWNVSNVTDMTEMFSGATSFTSENYDALLTEWAKLTLQNDVTFTAPPTTYCAGKAGRDKLTRPVADGGYNWTIYGDLGEDCPRVSVDEEFLSNAKIYSNPTRGKLSIESSFEIDKLELYNILGAKLFSVSKTNALDLTSLRQGIYILKVFSEDRVVSRKVIKD